MVEHTCQARRSYQGLAELEEIEAPYGMEEEQEFILVMPLHSPNVPYGKLYEVHACT